jgi:hypothetical protein
MNVSQPPHVDPDTGKKTYRYMHWGVLDVILTDLEYSGFFAIMTHGVDYDAMETLRTYGLRDEQEKYFRQLSSHSSDCSKNLPMFS